VFLYDAIGIRWSIDLVDAAVGQCRSGNHWSIGRQLDAFKSVGFKPFQAFETIEPRPDAVRRQTRQISEVQIDTYFGWYFGVIIQERRPGLHKHLSEAAARRI